MVLSRLEFLPALRAELQLRSVPPLFTRAPGKRTSERTNEIMSESEARVRERGIQGDCASGDPSGAASSFHKGSKHTARRAVRESAPSVSIARQNSGCILQTDSNCEGRAEATVSGHREAVGTRIDMVECLLVQRPTTSPARDTYNLSGSSP